MARLHESTLPTRLNYISYHPLSSFHMLLHPPYHFSGRGHLPLHKSFVYHNMSLPSVVAHISHTLTLTCPSTACPHTLHHMLGVAQLPTFTYSGSPPSHQPKHFKTYQDHCSSETLAHKSWCSNSAAPSSHPVANSSSYYATLTYNMPLCSTCFHNTFNNSHHSRRPSATPMVLLHAHTTLPPCVYNSNTVELRICASLVSRVT